MFTANQFRAKAAECAEMSKTTTVPSEIREFQRSTQSFSDLALNEDWKAGGHQHYLDWFFKEWMSNSKPTEQETQMLRLMKRSGFVELQKA